MLRHQEEMPPDHKKKDTGSGMGFTCFAASQLSPAEDLVPATWQKFDRAFAGSHGTGAGTGAGLDEWQIYGG